MGRAPGVVLVHSNGIDVLGIRLIISFVSDALKLQTASNVVIIINVFIGD